MPPVCSLCFPYLKFDTEKEFNLAVEKGSMFWIGYMVCDPKIFEKRSDMYDLHVNEICAMNFDDLPVMYNHKKQRKPLGKILLSWHDHKFPNSLFGVAFLAAITNKAILETPASVTLFGDSCPSLSTLKSDRKKTVEVSITYCGARKGCVGMFVSQERIREKCALFGLFANNLYKQNENEICASYLTMSQSLSLEEILVNLPSEQYEAVKKHLKSNREALENITEKAETMNDAVGLLSDFMGNMITTRLALEKNSTSELAKKRRNDFEMMKERGIFDGKCSDIDATREMLEYCKEYFDDKNEVTTKVYDMFQQKFPQLTNKLPVGDSSDTISTIDAAFNILDEEMKRKETQNLLKREKNAIERAKYMDVAKKQLKSVQNMSKKDISKVDDKETDREMSLEKFMQKCGMVSLEDRPSKKRKIAEEKHTEEDEDFIKYAMKKEQERIETENRYHQYVKQYQEEKVAKQNERQRQLDAVVESFPRINKLIESFPDFTMLHDLAKKIPKMVELLDTTEKKSEDIVSERPSHSDQVPQTHDLQRPTQKPETVDASLPLKETKNVDTVLFDM